MDSYMEGIGRYRYVQLYGKGKDRRSINDSEKDLDCRK